MQPTCHSEGILERRCENCDKTEHQSLPVTPHNYGDDNFCDDCGSDALTYILNNGTEYFVSDCDVNETLLNVNIPAIHLGLPVTQIADMAFSKCVSITQIELPASLTKIGVLAFADCKNITYITIPANVKIIDECAFANCYKLEEIAFDGNVEIIGRETFINCFALKSISLPDSVTEINYGLFMRCESLLSVKLGKNVKVIDDCAFTMCLSLTEIEIPEGVTSIPDYAFAGCTSLANVIMHENVTSIGRSAFEYCPELKTITIGSGVTYIGAYAFKDCNALARVYFENTEGWTVSSVVDLDELDTQISSAHLSQSTAAAYYLTNTYTAYVWWNVNSGAPDVPDDHRHVYGDDNFCDICGHDAFVYTLNDNKTGYILSKVDGHFSVATLTIPALHNDLPVVEIGESAFYGRAMMNIVLPDSLITIGRSAFYSCNNLKSIEIPDSVITIGEMAFDNCKNLTEIKFGKHVISIGRGAFAHCTALKSVTLPHSLTDWGTHIFSGCTSLVEVDLNGLTEIGKLAFNQCTALAEIDLSNVTHIGRGAFSYCASLKEVIITSSVTHIGEYAFLGCGSLASITFADPEGWTATGDEGQKTFAAEELSSPAENATLLINDYCQYAWTKSPKLTEHEHEYGDDNICDECGFDGLIYELNSETFSNPEENAKLFDDMDLNYRYNWRKERI